jgi:putative oxidoreductase
LLAGMAEFFGGLLFALGLATPLASALICAVMFVAIMSVHWRQGLWATEGGIEYPLVLMAVAFAVAATGAGEYSLDHALGLDYDGVAWGVAAVAAGLLGALFAFAVGRLDARGKAGGPRPAGA